LWPKADSQTAARLLEGLVRAGHRSGVLVIGPNADLIPDRIAPQLATLVGSPPTGAGWAYEIKLDGYRILARIEGGSVRFYTRNGNDWTAKMPLLAKESWRARCSNSHGKRPARRRRPFVASGRIVLAIRAVRRIERRQAHVISNVWVAYP
jgi:ATP dependent DNA ligase domain